MFKIYVEPESPNEGGCLRYILNRNRRSPMRGLEPESKIGGVFKIYVEPKSPNEGSCLRYMMNRYSQMRGRVKDVG